MPWPDRYLIAKSRWRLLLPEPLFMVVVAASVCREVAMTVCWWGRSKGERSCGGLDWNGMKWSTRLAN